MIRRPVSVTIVSWVLVAAGAVGFVYHATEFRSVHSFPAELLGVELVRILAIVSGLFMLRGADWARWLAIAWIAFHVVLSAFHSLGEFAMHAVLLMIFAYFLFRSGANAFFRRRGVSIR